MEGWSQFKAVIGQWSRFEITDDQFYQYLITSEFECAADRRVAALFITQHDGGEWTHSIYHRKAV